MPQPPEQPYVASGRPDLSPAGDRTGWHEPLPHAPPRPTFWPAVMAFAIAVTLWGVVLNYIVWGTALVLFAIACAGWVGDLLRE